MIELAWVRLRYVQKLQRRGFTGKAKGAPNYRFYLSYDKLYRKAVLTYRYER